VAQADIHVLGTGFKVFVGAVAAVGLRILGVHLHIGLWRLAFFIHLILSSSVGRVIFALLFLFAATKYNDDDEDYKQRNTYTKSNTNDLTLR
jgi:hypothetical protein